MKGSILKWFKHYTNAHKGDVFQELSAEFGKVTAYGWYFLLVEYLTDMWDGKSEPRFKVLMPALCGHLTATPSRLRRYLTAMQRLGKLEYTENGKLIDLEFYKLSEIRHRDAVRASKDPAELQHDAAQNRIDEKRTEENRSEWLYKSDSDLKKAISLVDQSFFKKEYPDLEWFDRELTACFNHFAADEVERPRTKGKWMQKLHGWLKRGWEKKLAEPKPNVIPATGGYND